MGRVLFHVQCSLSSPAGWYSLGSLSLSNLQGFCKSGWKSCAQAALFRSLSLCKDMMYACLLPWDTGHQRLAACVQIWGVASGDSLSGRAPSAAPQVNILQLY